MIIAIVLGSITFLQLLLALLLFLYKKLFVSSQLNEWLVVLDKDGKQKKAGVGMSFITSTSDSFLKFPSSIHRVQFQTQQIDQNKQGLQVSGDIIWSINRVDDGPFRAYKFLGEDIRSDNPGLANEKLRNISESIVRDCIAKSTIHNILSNRNEIRKTISSQMQKEVSGWGIWLETVEITDVTISSSSLFGDMQIKYREYYREKAQQIKEKTEDQIKREKMKYEFDLYQLTSENIQEKEKINQENEVQLRKVKQQNQMKIDEAQAKEDQEIDVITKNHNLKLNELEYKLDLFKMKIKQQAEERRFESERRAQEINAKISLVDQQIQRKQQAHLVKVRLEYIKSQHLVAEAQSSRDKLQKSQREVLDDMEKKQTEDVQFMEYKQNNEIVDEKILRHKVLKCYRASMDQVRSPNVSIVSVEGGTAQNGIVPMLGAVNAMNCKVITEN